MEEDIYIREAGIADAAQLLDIYRYYVEETAVTFEYEVPTIQEFSKRIADISSEFPYIVAARKDPETGNEEILGYAYASHFHPRAAYQWCTEMTIYLNKDMRRGGIGRFLYTELERRLTDKGYLNLNACIGYPEEEDEHLTFDSVRFHEKMGYKMVGEFHKCGYKFGRWYNMVWMEKIVGDHIQNPKPIR